LQQLSKIPNLGYINLRNANVSDGGLKEIGKLQIAHLILDENPITNEGLKELATLKQLRTLSLKNTEISDDGMIHVKELKFLSTIYLSKTKVTDIGLHELVELTELELIALDETPVTNAGVRMLWKSLPKRGKVILR
jgi:hypothetical protein